MLTMLRDRLIVILIVIPLGMAVLLAGGFWYAGCVALVMCLAAGEFSRLFSKPEMHIPAGILAAGIAALILMRWLYGFTHAGLLLAGIIFVCVIWFLIRFERGMEKQAASAMAITLGGALYLGWFSGYFISLRELPYGLWWTLISLAAVGLTDSMAFLVGKGLGKHPLTRRVSPNKTWEGYFGGWVGGALGGLLCGWLFHITAGSASGIDPWRGLLLGFLIGLLSPLGDLAISMMKREAAQKDTGNFFPGHGGILDRIDSWLVMAVVGYYVVSRLIPVLPF
jgi:phosphatidate cytidylyltransferase